MKHMPDVLNNEINKFLIPSNYPPPTSKEMLMIKKIILKTVVTHLLGRWSQ